MAPRSRSRPAAELRARLLTEAADPATAPYRLAELAAAPTTRPVQAAVAANPNTPRTTLLALAGRHWEAFLANPVLPLLLLEDPGLPARLPLRVLRMLVRQEGVAPYLLQTLARHPDREVREGAKYHVDFPVAEQQEAEAADWHAELRRELEKVPAQRATLPELLDLDVMPAWLLESVASTGNSALRTALLTSSRRPDASPALQQVGQLVRRTFGEWETETVEYSWGPSERRSLNGRGYLSEAEAVRLAGGSAAWQVQAARASALPLAELEKLARSPHRPVRVAVARHPRLTPVAAMTLATRGEEPVLRALAQSAVVPEALLPTLARSKHTAVRRGVARNGRTPGATLAQLATDPDGSVRLAAARHRNTPLEALTLLLADMDPEIRQAVGRNHNCSAELFEKLLTDPAEKVREAVARRTGLPAAIIRRFLDDPSGEVRHAAVYNHSTPRHIVDFMHECSMNPPAERPPMPEWGTGKGWRFSGKQGKRLDPSDDYKTSRLYSKVATEDEQRAWATSPTPAVRAAVGHMSQLTDVLAQLVADPKTQVRAGVAGNHAAPIDILRRLVADPKKTVRAALAGNHQYPTPDPALPEVLRPLAADPKATVRYRAAINQQMPPDALLPLATDPSAKVRGHLPFNPALSAEAIAVLDADPRATPNMRRGILTHANTPLSILLARFAEATPTELDHLAHNAQLPVEYLRQIADRCWAEKGVRSALAYNPNTPPDLLERLWEEPYVRHSGDYTHTRVAQHPNTPDALLRRIVVHDDASLASAVEGNPRFSEALFRELLPLITRPQTKQYFLYKQDTPAFVYEVLREAGGEEVLRTMASRKDAPPATQQALLDGIVVEKYGSNSVAYNLANNATVAPELLHALLNKYAERDATDREPQWWYQYIAANPQATPELLDRLVGLLRAHAERYQYQRYRSGRGNDGLAVSLIQNHKLKPEHLPFFAAHESLEVRYALLQRPDCPPELKQQMRAAAVKRNLNSATSLLGRAAALSDAATSAEWLHHLHPQARWLERLAMVQNPNLPPDLLATLAQDAHRLVRAAAQERLATGQIPELTAN